MTEFDARACAYFSFTGREGPERRDWCNECGWTGAPPSPFVSPALTLGKSPTTAAYIYVRTNVTSVLHALEGGALPARVLRYTALYDAYDE